MWKHADFFIPSCVTAISEHTEAMRRTFAAAMPFFTPALHSFSLSQEHLPRPTVRIMPAVAKHTERYQNMQSVYEIIGYHQILQQLSALAVTAAAKKAALTLQPCLQEIRLMKELSDTAQAKEMIEIFSAPPLPAMERVEEFVARADTGELLSAAEIESVGSFLTSVSRMISYLERGCERRISLAFYRENLHAIQELRDEILRCIRNGRVDDAASPALKDIRRKCILLEEKIREKAESILRSQKSCMAESFTVNRSGRLCLPVKKDCKSRIPGQVVDKSSTGATLFIEPASVAALREEYELCKLEEENEERIVLYTLLSMIAEQKETLLQNIRTLEKLDFAFAKGKLAVDMKAVCPAINTEGYIELKEARHPSLPEQTAVPLDFSLGKENRGMIITGPNTGGKTVSIKTVGLLALMANSGLFVPCQEADICMCNQVLSDIGDGQNISDNLSTFSAHITNVIDILRRVTGESLVLLDELGSGTDPAEGMGIAIAVLEKLRESGCLFLVTTHYPEVKTYAETTSGIVNARMAFDRDNLKPLYRLEMGESGESCALYIAKRLGMPDDMLLTAARATYKEKSPGVARNLRLSPSLGGLQRSSAPSIEKKKRSNTSSENLFPYQRGDSVTVLPDGVIGIVVNPADRQGNVLVQIQKEKQLINHKRLRLKVAAKELYPEDYDFSIIFDSVETRKARRQMSKHHQEGLTLEVEDY